MMHVTTFTPPGLHVIRRIKQAFKHYYCGSTVIPLLLLALTVISLLLLLNTETSLLLLLVTVIPLLLLVNTIRRPLNGLYCYCYHLLILAQCALTSVQCTVESPVHCVLTYCVLCTYICVLCLYLTIVYIPVYCVLSCLLFTYMCSYICTVCLPRICVLYTYLSNVYLSLYSIPICVLYTFLCNV